MRLKKSIWKLKIYKGTSKLGLEV